MYRRVVSHYEYIFVWLNHCPPTACSAVHQSVRSEDKLLPVMGVVASWPVERISWCLLLWGHLSLTDPHRCIFIDALTSCFYLHAFVQSLCILKDSLLHFRHDSLLQNSSQWITNKDFHIDLVRQLFPYSCKTWYVFKVKPWISLVKLSAVWCVKLKSQTFGEIRFFLQALLKCNQSMKLASKLSLALKQVESWERELAWLVNTLKCKSDNLPFFWRDLFWDISWSSGWFLFYLHSK